MSSVIELPRDKHGNPIQKGMGIPVVTPSALLLGSNTKFVDLLDLSIFPARIFHGITVRNPSALTNLIISMGPDFSADEDIIVSPTNSVTFEGLLFGNSNDLTKSQDIKKIRARLTAASGVLSLATIDYSGSGQPSDGELVNVNGFTYEFSNDLSKDQTSDVIVTIGVDQDASWTNFINAVNGFEQAVTASINVGGDLVTITSNFGGTFGDGLVVADGGTPTGAAFSGNTAGGTLGVAARVHIW